jgi:E3 ubiquitin-protein ligase BOI-like protein
MHVWNFLDQVREEARKQQGQEEEMMPAAAAGAGAGAGGQLSEVAEAAAKPVPAVTPSSPALALGVRVTSTSDSDGARSKRYDGSSARKGCGGVKGVCAVCMIQPCSVVLLPCRHLVLCRGCSGEVEAQGLGCPLCQEVVEKHLVVHRS